MEPAMYPVLYKEVLSDQVKLVVVKAPRVASKAQPGQFVLVKLDETGERIPLTIADFDPQLGTITLIFQEVGKSTKKMGMLEVGDGFDSLAGPLGHPTQIQDYGTVVLVAGGVGIAPLFPIVRSLKQSGNKVLTILGARTQSLLFWQNRMAQFSDELILCTDDGSNGRKALVTEPLKEIIALNNTEISHIWAIGPAVMMKNVVETTRPYQIPTTVSLNTIMIDGTGMCGGCRVVMDDGAKFVCVDGPEFDGHLVDWDNLLSRQSYYRSDEKYALELWESHACKLESSI
jgi:ferredoxin/flavodoxin---NADP+ reductase